MKTLYKYAGLASLLLLSAGCHKGGDTSVAAHEAGNAEASPVTVALAPAQTARMEETEEAQGTLAPATGSSARLAFPVAGRIGRILVHEGDTVSPGQVVAELDARAQAAQVQSAQAGVRAFGQQVEQARLSALAAQNDQAASVRLTGLSLAAALADRDAGIQAAQTSLKLAQADLARTIAPPQSAEVAQSEAALAQAQATETRAQSEKERQQFLFDKGVSARRQLEDAQTALAVAQGGVQTARQSGLLLRAGARPAEREAARLRVTQAQQVIASTRQSGDAKVAQARQALSQAEQGRTATQAKQQEVLAAVSNAQKSQADALAVRTQAAQTVLRSPIAGVVTRRTGNPGDLSDPATPVLEITNTKFLVLTASLAGSSGGRIRAGETAHLLDDTGKTVGMGRVESVGQVDPQTNLLTVRVRVPNQKNTLRVGAFYGVRIVTRTAPQAVVVPKSAVIQRDGKSVVYLVGKDDTAHQKEVSVGAEQNGNVEIHGVKAGEQIVTLGGYELADGAKIKTADEPKNAKETKATEK